MPKRYVSDSDLSRTLTEDEILEVKYGTPERADKLLDKAARRAREQPM